jgi:hypothetical protein
MHPANRNTQRHQRPLSLTACVLAAILSVGAGAWVSASPANATSSATKRMHNPLVRAAGTKTCQNTSYPGFRGAKQTHSWTTSPQCHTFAKGKHLVCENASGGVVYVESSTWDVKTGRITTRFFISQPYKNYDVTTYTWNLADDTYHARSNDNGTPTHATRKYGPKGATHFRYSSVSIGKETLMLEIKCQRKPKK